MPKINQYVKLSIMNILFRFFSLLCGYLPDSFTYFLLNTEKMVNYRQIIEINMKGKAINLPKEYIGE